MLSVCVQGNVQDGLDSTLMEPEKILSQARHELKSGWYERGLYYAEQGIMALIDLEDMYSHKIGTTGHSTTEYRVSP